METVATRSDRTEPRPAVLPSSLGGPELTEAEEKFEAKWAALEAVVPPDSHWTLTELHDFAGQRVTEAYDAGMLRGIGKLAVPDPNAEMPPDKILLEVTRSVTALAGILIDLVERI